MLNFVFKCCDNELDLQGAGRTPLSIAECKKCENFFIVYRRPDGKYEITSKQRSINDDQWWGR